MNSVTDKANNLSAVIFDMDGVIVDSNPVHVKSLEQYCKKLEFHLTDEYMKNKIFGRTNREWITDMLGGKVSPETIKYHSEEKEKLFRNMFTTTIQPLEGLISFLEILKKYKVLSAVASSAISSNVNWVLEKTKTTEYFDVVIDESYVSHSKPDPEIYLKTAKLLGVEPQNCVVFEDSFPGVQAAKTAGCKVVAITTTHPPDEFLKVDLIIRNFREINMSKLYALF